MVDPYGTEEILFEGSTPVAPLLTIDYGDEVQEAEFIFRPTKGSFDADINNVAIIQSVKGNTSVVNNELVDCKMVSIKTTGFNQWDEEWKNGYYDGNDGGRYKNGNNVCCKNPIGVFPSTQYYFAQGITTANGLCFYDCNMNFISFQSITANVIFTTPANARFMTFYLSGGYGSTYNNDICINISYASKNGTYESYWGSITNLPVTTLKGRVNGIGSSVVVFPDGMKSAGDERDEIKVENGTLKGFKRVGTRAYQSGDVDSSTITTDGVSYTNYVLSTPEEYIIDDVNVEKVMLGSTEITKVYLGNQLIFESN